MDITNTQDVSEAVEGVVRWTKATNAPLGGVVNCAGVATAAKILDGHGNPHSIERWNFTLAVNLTGTFNLTRLVCKHLKDVRPEGDDEERGVVVFVSSSSAFEGQPGQAAYSASKGALGSMVLPLARDLAEHGIRVNAIAPAAFTSAMTDLLPRKTRASLERELVFPRRFGLPHEFAQTVRWMIECGYMNGETVRLTGGARLPGRL